MASYFKPKSKQHDPFIIREGDFKKGRLDRSYRLDWTEESYISEGRKGETIGRVFNFSRLYFVTIIFAAFLLLILSRTAWLQIARGEYYYSMAEGNRIRVARLEAKRGIIYDRNYQPLVINSANFILYFIPADLPAGEEFNKVMNKVNKILLAPVSQEITDKIKTIKRGSLESYEPLFVVDNIPYEQAMLLYLEAANIPGAMITTADRRAYDVTSISLAHILGYTGKISQNELDDSGGEYSSIDYIGKSGIEYFWENELRGVNGKKQIEVDAFGKEKKIIGQELPVDGRNLVLSLDSQAQSKMEEILSSHLEKLNLKKAVGIALNPNNGEILALVSLPSYNNNVFSRGITAAEYEQLINNPDYPLFNRAISGEYPSGSTIKPVIAAAALAEGVITEHTSFTSVGGIKIDKWFFPDWKAGGHGITDVRRAIAESINTFFYYIGGGYEDFNGLGVERIANYGRLFGLGEQTGFDLPGEAKGFLPSKEWKEEVKDEIWYIGDTYHLAIGQGDILVTPLQVANFTSVFANGGRLYRPHLIRQLLSGDEKLMAEVDVKPIKDNFIDNYNLQIVREGMRQTITSGSAASLNNLPVEVAGKTGTAQWSSKNNPHAWFTGFAPYNDPEIVLTILIEEGGEGSSVAVPIANEFFSWYFNRVES